MAPRFLELGRARGLVGGGPEGVLADAWYSERASEDAGKKAPGGATHPEFPAHNPGRALDQRRAAAGGRIPRWSRPNRPKELGGGASPGHRRRAPRQQRVQGDRRTDSRGGRPAHRSAARGLAVLARITGRVVTAEGRQPPQGVKVATVCAGSSQPAARPQADRPLRDPPAPASRLAERSAGVPPDQELLRGAQAACQRRASLRALPQFMPSCFLTARLEGYRNVKIPIGFLTPDDTTIVGRRSWLDIGLVILRPVDMPGGRTLSEATAWRLRLHARRSRARSTHWTGRIRTSGRRSVVWRQLSSCTPASLLHGTCWRRPDWRRKTGAARCRP